MKGASRTIAKNAGVLLVTQLVTWGLTLLLTVFQPRYLGAAGVGALSIAASIWAIIGVFTAFGSETLLIKEIARRPERAASLVSTAIVVRLLLYTLSWLAVGLYLYLGGVSELSAVLVLIAGAGMLLSQVSGPLSAAIQGLEVMEYSAAADISFKLVNTLLAIGTLLLGYGVVVVALVGVVAALVSLLVQLGLLGRRLRLKPHFNLRAAKALLHASTPYMFSGLVLICYGRVDTLLIASMVDAHAVGWYSVATQLFGTLMFVPTVLITALFPALSRSHEHDQQALVRLMGKSFDLLLLVAVPVGLGMLAIADPLVVLLFGSEFAPSGPILAVLGLVLICTYQTTLVGRFLTSADRQNSWTIFMLLALLATIPLDLLLVPWCQQQFGNGALGGALSFLITEAAMLLAGLLLLPRGALGWRNAGVALRVVLAGAAMAATAWWLREQLLVIPIVAGALVYTALIALLRVVPREDAALVWALAARSWQRNQHTESEPEMPLFRKKGAVAALPPPPDSFPPEVVESMRRMITQLAYQQRLPARIAVLAALREEGVTYSAMALASTLASDMNLRVCAVELNWQTPGMQARLTRSLSSASDELRRSLPPERRMRSPGLAAVLSGAVTLDAVLVPSAIPNLMLLPAGNLPPEQRAMAARSEALRDCIEQLSQRFDHVILDVPAILTTSDAIALASLGTAGCLVVRHGVTDTNQVRRALDEVKHLPMLGVVLNRTRIRSPRWVQALMPGS